LAPWVAVAFAASAAMADETPVQRDQGERIPVSVKRIWAHRLLWTDAPKLEVKQWLTEEPDLDGKFILVEFWRTWCGACRRLTPLMNELHRKYGDELVVVGITGESAETVRTSSRGPKKEYFLAIDKPREAVTAKENLANTSPDDSPEGDENPDVESERMVARQDEQGAFEAHFGVWGWPHVVLLEPRYRGVVWEGFPGLKGHELTVEKVGKYLEIGRKASGKSK
jgi:thiol-disulfide isomerase/thioredoxin